MSSSRLERCDTSPAPNVRFSFGFNRWQVAAIVFFGLQLAPITDGGKTLEWKVGAAGGILADQDLFLVCNDCVGQS
jgi:hypothetical protein